MKRVAPAVALLIALAVPAWADAYLRGDYSTAFQEFEPFAKQGNARAQYNLGLMYDNGHGVPQDYAEAVRWYRKAAEQGDARAQLNLGVMYSKGQGVPQDYVQAHMWFHPAAPQGEKQAAENRDRFATRMAPAHNSHCL